MKFKKVKQKENNKKMESYILDHLLINLLK